MPIISSEKYPDVALFRQHITASGLKDLPAAVSQSLSTLSVLTETHPGDTVAVAVGSRGIRNLHVIVFQCIQFLKKNGLRPFIVPAMGSHGGATPAGQKAVLEQLGITESSMGVPVDADMNVVCLAELRGGPKLYVSKSALNADHLVVINRVKPHTKFSAEIESGLCKMLAIGLGKAKGAALFHQYAVKRSFKIIEMAADVILQKLDLLFGMAVIEDGHSEVAHVEAVLPSMLISREKELLRKASAMMGRIPFDYLDILIVDVFGKDISGIGMDPNITGRHRDIVGDYHASPHVKRIFVRDLSPGSDGNANGMGLADVTTHRFVNAIDLEKTYINAITAISPEKASIPMHFEADRTCMDACFKTIGLDKKDNARIVRIKDTMHLEYLQLSRALEKDILTEAELTQISAWAPMAFDAKGNLEDLPIVHRKNEFK